MSTLDAVVEPFIQHDIAQPALAQIARELRADRIKHAVPMPARAGLYFREPRVVIHAKQQIRIRRSAVGVLEYVSESQRRRITATFIDRQVQRTIAFNFGDQRSVD